MNIIKKDCSNKLPIEIWELVFKHLGHDDYKKCMHINKEWNMRTNQLWMDYIHVRIRFNDDIEKLIVDITDYPQLRTKIKKLSIGIRDPHSWALVAHLCPNLHTISFETRNPYFFLGRLLFNDIQLPKLSHIELKSQYKHSPACIKRLDACYVKYVNSR